LLLVVVAVENGLQVEVEQVDIEHLVHFQFAEQQDIQLQ
jgi:hypothetical protein